MELPSTSWTLSLNQLTLAELSSVSHFALSLCNVVMQLPRGETSLRLNTQKSGPKNQYITAAHCRSAHLFIH